MKISDLKNYKVVSGSSPVSIPQEKSGGQKFLDTATSVSNFFGGKGVSDLIGGLVAKAVVPKEQRQFVNLPSAKEVAGSALQLGANFLPGVGEVGLAGRVALGAGAGYAMDVGSKMQQNKTLGETITPGVGTIVGGGLPIAGAVISPAKNIVSRLFKGLGSGLSGLSTESIDKIIANPEVAQQVSDKLAQSGNSKVLEDNAKTIVNGVSKVRQEARNAYGQAVQGLKTTDINPTTFRTSVGQALDSVGSVVKNGERKLTTAEFDNPAMLKKANTLINKLSTTKLDGYSLNKLQNEIDSSAFETTGSDAQRLSFNAFINDLSSSVKNAINQSTNKLQEINKAYSSDMQLAEATQNIFGNVNFKNLPEVVKASQKLEGLFSQKGLAPDVVDKFLTRIGVSPEAFKTSEAVRQISNKATGANTKGLSVGEIMQQVTSSVLTPTAVKNLSIYTGLAEKNVVPFLKALKPALRNTVIQALIQANQ